MKEIIFMIVIVQKHRPYVVLVFFPNRKKEPIELDFDIGKNDLIDKVVISQCHNLMRFNVLYIFSLFSPK